MTNDLINLIVVYFAEGSVVFMLSRLYGSLINNNGSGLDDWIY
jgi:hypothetical protein